MTENSPSPTEAKPVSLSEKVLQQVDVWLDRVNQSALPDMAKAGLLAPIGLDAGIRTFQNSQEAGDHTLTSLVKAAGMAALQACCPSTEMMIELGAAKPEKILKDLSGLVTAAGGTATSVQEFKSLNIVVPQLIEQFAASGHAEIALGIAAFRILYPAALGGVGAYLRHQIAQAQSE